MKVPWGKAKGGVPLHVETVVWSGVVEGLPVYFIEPRSAHKYFWRGCFYGECVAGRGGGPNQVTCIRHICCSFCRCYCCPAASVPCCCWPGPPVARCYCWPEPAVPVPPAAAAGLSPQYPCPLLLLLA